MFRRKYQVDEELTKRRIDYPDGAVLQNGSNYFMVTNGKLFKFFSERVFKSWNVTAIEVSSESIAHFQNASKPLGFRNGSLLHNVADGKFYYVSNNKLRHIQNPDWFDEYGLGIIEFVNASQQEVNLHDEGEPLT